MYIICYPEKKHVQNYDASFSFPKYSRTDSSMILRHNFSTSQDYSWVMLVPQFAIMVCRFNHGEACKDLTVIFMRLNWIALQGKPPVVTWLVSVFPSDGIDKFCCSDK